MAIMQASPRPALAQMQERLVTGLPLFWFALAFLTGVLLALWVDLQVWIWFLLAAAVGLAAFTLRRFAPPPYALIAFYLTALLLGAGRLQLAKPAPDAFDIASYNDRQYDVLVTGWVAEMPDRRDTYTNLRLHVEAVDTGDGDMPAHGLILARVGENELFHYGQRLRPRGLLKTPPEDEDFSYRDYLAARGVLAYHALHRGHPAARTKRQSFQCRPVCPQGDLAGSRVPAVPGPRGFAAGGHPAGRGYRPDAQPAERLQGHGHRAHHRHFGL